MCFKSRIKKKEKKKRSYFTNSKRLLWKYLSAIFVKKRNRIYYNASDLLPFPFYHQDRERKRFDSIVRRERRQTSDLWTSTQLEQNFVLFYRLKNVGNVGNNFISRDYFSGRCPAMFLSFFLSRQIEGNWR